MLEFSLKVVVTFLTVIDPVGLVPLVVGMLGTYSKDERIRIITRATLIAAGVVAVFGVFGRFIFATLGISIDAFNIAGGVLLFLVAIDMLFGRPSGVRETSREQEEAITREDISVFPLAIPLIAGPGTIASVILLVSSAGNDSLRLSAIAVGGILVLALAWVAMRLSFLIERSIGTTGILVLSRILGMLLAALAVQFILNGISQFIASNHITHCLQVSPQLLFSKIRMVGTHRADCTPPTTAKWFRQMSSLRCLYTGVTRSCSR